MYRSTDARRLASRFTLAGLLLSFTLFAQEPTAEEIDKLAVRAMEAFHVPGTTHIALLPEKDVAVIALTNQWTSAPRAITSEVLDAYASETPEDWVEIYAGSATESAERARKVVAEAFASRNADSAPTLPLESYVGAYRDRWYGDVFVEGSGDGLVMRFSRSELLTGPLEHFQYDTFVARWHDRSLLADAYVTFLLGADGEVEAIRMKMLSPDTDFSFDYHHLDLRRVVEE